jgi:hypothetical protein
MSRRVYLLGIGIALVALAFVLTDALLWEPGITEANVRRVRVGMTLADVQALFGDEPEMELGGDGTQSLRWWSEQGAAWVHFDENQRVQSAEFERNAKPSWPGRYRPRPARPGLNPLARLRAWLGW